MFFPPFLFSPSRQLRKLISDFSIFMSILMFVGLDVLFGLNTPKLQVPTDFKVKKKKKSNKIPFLEALPKISLPPIQGMAVGDVGSPDEHPRII